MSNTWYNIITEINQDAAAAAESEDVMNIYLVEMSRGFLNPAAVNRRETLLEENLSQEEAAREADKLRKVYKCDGITSDIIIKEEEN